LLSKLSLPFGMTCFILLGFWGGWWDEFFADSAKSSSQAVAAPSIVMDQIKVIFWNNLEKKFQMKAEKLSQGNDNLQVHFEKITKTDVFSIKDQKFNFTAGWAQLEKFRNLLSFGGGVQIKTDQGVFNSEKATMNYKAQEISFDQKVDYQANGYLLEAGGMKFRVADKQQNSNEADKMLVYFKNKVKLVHSEATIEALSLDYDLKAETGLFYNNVVMNRNVVANEENKSSEPFVLTTNELYFENKTKNFEAKGKSQLQNEKFTGEAENMKYDDLKQELLLTKNVHLRKKVGEEITGDSLKIDLKENDFVMQKNVNINLELEE